LGQEDSLGAVAPRAPPSYMPDDI